MIRRTLAALDVTAETVVASTHQGPSVSDGGLRTTTGLTCTIGKVAELHWAR
jgi:hypothetical protein